MFSIVNTICSNLLFLSILNLKFNYLTAFLTLNLFFCQSDLILSHLLTDCVCFFFNTFPNSLTTSFVFTVPSSSKCTSFVFLPIWSILIFSFFPYLPFEKCCRSLSIVKTDDFVETHHCLLVYCTSASLWANISVFKMLLLFPFSLIKILVLIDMLLNKHALLTIFRHANVH